MIGLGRKRAAASSLVTLGFPRWQRRCTLLTYSCPGRAAGVAAGHAHLLWAAESGIDTFGANRVEYVMLMRNWNEFHFYHSDLESKGGGDNFAAA